MFLINIRAQHQPHIRNLAQITNPVADRKREIPRLKPVGGKVNPCCLCADRLLITDDISGGNVVFARIMRIGPDAAKIKSVIQLPAWRRRNRSG